LENFSKPETNLFVIPVTFAYILLFLDDIVLSKLLCQEFLILEPEFLVDNLEVANGIELALDVNYVSFLKSTHDVVDGVNGLYV
ncbi:hypothetical protein BC937DRAFT_91608, partial [Endogone sp. FLAS-F59071]